MAKADRVAKKHYGLQKTKRPVPWVEGIGLEETHERPGSAAMNLLTVDNSSGMRVIVARPWKKRIPRSWKERLFTRPWRPFQATHEIWIQPEIGPDECYRIGNVIQCGEQFYERLKAHTVRQ
jgi:hypothetical protein